MFRTIDDFLESWSRETEATVKVFENLTDESLDQRAAPHNRTLGRTAWHIVQTLPEMGGRTGLDIAGPGEDDPVPVSAAEIAARLRETSESLAAEVKAKWSDADLETEDDLYGESWPRGKTLAALVNHQIHHRGQMTVLMRMAGLRVPGVYGPSMEEWADYGMPAPE